MVATSVHLLSFKVSSLVDVDSNPALKHVFSGNHHWGLEQPEWDSPAPNGVSAGEMTQFKQVTLSSVEVHGEKQQIPEDGHPPTLGWDTSRREIIYAYLFWL